MIYCEYCKISLIDENAFNRHIKSSYHIKQSIRKYREITLKNKPQFCNNCHIITSYFIVHHIDHNRKNNIHSNLIILCEKCHNLEKFRKKVIRNECI